jgi:hypothetical protein
MLPRADETGTSAQCGKHAPPSLQICVTALLQLFLCSWLRMTSIFTRSRGATHVLLTTALHAPHAKCFTASFILIIRSRTRRACRLQAHWKRLAWGGNSAEMLANCPVVRTFLSVQCTLSEQALAWLACWPCATPRRNIVQREAQHCVTLRHGSA